MKSGKFEIVLLVLSVFAGVAAINSPESYRSPNQLASNNYAYPTPYPYPGPVCSFLYAFEFPTHTGAYQNTPATSVIYVNKNATGLNNGSSWANAYTDLQPALQIASTGDEVWVASGVYRPTQTTDRDISFELKNGVSIYGGFHGTETQASQRKPNFHVTILSGDLNQDDIEFQNNAENSHHVVRGYEIDETAILDGFTITDGNANGVLVSENQGGGLLLYNSNPTLRNLKFIGNYASFGGGISNSNSDPTLVNVIFSTNCAESGGGGMYNSESNPNLTNVSFNQNLAKNNGGGMINYLSSPILNDVNFQDNSAVNNGGGISNIDNSNPNLTNVIFTNNVALQNGGGIWNAYSNNVPISLDDVTFNGNRAMNNGGGVFNESSLITIANSTFDNNSAENNGGAIYNIDGVITISNSTFNSNTSTADILNSAWLKGGGAIYSINSVITISDSIFNSNTSNANGGAIFNHTGNLNILNSTFLANSSELDGGGAIFNHLNSTVNINNTAFRQNSAGGVFGAGGAIANIGNLTVHNSEFTNNTAIDGGGAIVNSIGGTAVIANSTITANSSINGGGGVATADPVTVTTFINITFSDNSGGGLYIFDGIVHLRNSILANCIGQHDCYKVSGNIVTNQNNLIETNSGCGTPASTADPLLGPLADNGGFTQTMALLSGSPAINAGDNATCEATDQRGVTRPQGSACDIGAYEKLDIVTPTFADVPLNASGWSHIESIYTAGITGGCTTSPLNYCPNNTVNRAQMAIFLMRGIHGSAYAPPPATGTVFNDVPSNAFGAAFIEAFANQGITGGCGAGNYCPNNTVTRAQMAIFLLRAKYGSSYTPPTATGTMFSDVPLSHPFATWIEQLASEGITGGCGGGNYCPNNSVTRAQMAIFIQRTFNLPLP